jgi:hypothetical protein
MAKADHAFITREAEMLPQRVGKSRCPSRPLRTSKRDLGQLEFELSRPLVAIMSYNSASRTQTEGQQ